MCAVNVGFISRLYQHPLLDTLLSLNTVDKAYTLMMMFIANAYAFTITWLILGMCLANERRRYKVTPSLIGWAQT